MRRAWALGGVLALLAAGPAAPPAGAPAIVAARDHDAFWLWAGTSGARVPPGARRLYLLAGEVRARAPVRLVSQRAAVPHVTGPEVWLVLRVETLRWPPDVTRRLLALLDRWRGAGNRVAGVQIDFDARTRHLADYAAFLRALRRRLPRDCRLGVTGLLDWSANGDPAGLAALAGTVDEVVLQIYQGRHVIPGYRAYLERLGRLPVPFRVGVLEGGEWRPPPSLALDPRYRGIVVFLLAPRGGRKPIRSAVPGFGAPVAGA